MLRIPPTVVDVPGYQLQRPPLPLIYTPRSCGGAAPSCHSLLCMHKRELRRASRNVSYKAALCGRCECALCLACARPRNLWKAPSGQTLETVTTRTDPPFTFAYNPADADMKRMREQLVLEPVLTHAWHEATWRCCGSGGLVVDVGGNFGWYTLYSLALGCRVVVFEPVPLFQEVLRLGVTLNPGFATRVELYGNVVYDAPGNYTLRVPLPGGMHRKKLGMTGMNGARGILKSDFNAKAATVSAGAVRIDDVLRGRDVCLLKADVEGYEPQVMQTAQKLLATREVPNLQLELSRTRKDAEQTCAAVKMLSRLSSLGYEFKQVPNQLVDAELPPPDSWQQAAGPWARLPSFPTAATAAAAAAGGERRPTMQLAYDIDFATHSTNLVARRRSTPLGAASLPWPSLGC
mmetsp:Transcript_26967/g.85807  ORF Transcript_26967/g.85807 Transcript_26967/m.85807 type:complete len:405 (-) Transcript_26967:270-1484(-)